MPRGDAGGRNLKDMTGKTFDRLTVIERAGTTADRKALWLCRCACGTEKIVSGKELRNGHVRSCGCLLTEVNGLRASHGGCGTRLYSIWKNMLKRCRNPNMWAYDRYGGRGIYVCEAWHDFAAFRDWALANGYRDDLTIDRFPDNDGPYHPGNCRWATMKEQRHNRNDHGGLAAHGI